MRMRNTSGHQRSKGINILMVPCLGSDFILLSFPPRADLGKAKQWIEAVRRAQLLYNHGSAGWLAGSDYHHPPAAAALLDVAAHFDLSKQQNQVSGMKLLAFELFKFFVFVFLQTI